MLSHEEPVTLQVCTRSIPYAIDHLGYKEWMNNAFLGNEIYAHRSLSHELVHDIRKTKITFLNFPVNLSPSSTMEHKLIAKY